MTTRDRVLELAESIAVEINQQMVSLPKVRLLSATLCREAEMQAASLKVIQDIAHYGRIPRRTKQWLRALDTGAAPDGGTPEAA